MKVPPHQYDATVKFYEEILRLERIGGPQGDAVGCKFGANNLWIDKVPAMSQAELWPEIVTDDTKEAAQILAKAGVARCDDIEPLGESFDGYWISSPSSISATQNGGLGINHGCKFSHKLRPRSPNHSALCRQQDRRDALWIA